MPRLIIKPRPELDEYLIWSTIVDCPVSGVLNRATMRETWRIAYSTLATSRLTVEEAEEFMAYADRWGWTGPGPLPDHAFVYVANIEGYTGQAEEGTCAMRDLPALARAMGRADWPAVDKILADGRRLLAASEVVGVWPA